MDHELTHNGIRVRILDGLYLAGGKPTAEAVACYSSLVDRLDRFRRAAARELLSLYNDTWLDEEIGELEEAGFAVRLEDPVVVLYDAIGSASMPGGKRAPPRGQ